MIAKTIRSFAAFALATVLALATSHGIPTAQSGGPLEHEVLRIHNDFRNPEDVVAYYCGRDASGFVWSGMLNVEVRAFTTWSEAPEQDTFFIAHDYTITREKMSDTQAAVRVHYNLAAVGDGNLTRLPAQPTQRDVVFELVKEGGHWKIARPSAAEISPVVLETKFPFGAPSTADAGAARKVSSR